MIPVDIKLMSADDHMIEPAQLWVDRVPAAIRDRCSRIVETEAGRQAWLFEDDLAHLNMGSWRPLEGFPIQGFPPAPGTARYDEIRPGCYDPVARIIDMDIDVGNQNGVASRFSPNDGAPTCRRRRRWRRHLPCVLIMVH